MKLRQRTATGVIAVLLLPLAACGSGSSSKSNDVAAGSTVHLKLLLFNPSTLTVSVGTKVRFVNDEVISHTVTTGTYTIGAHNFRSTETPDGKLNAQLKRKGDSATYVFSTPGTYTYYCSIHKAMQGQIVVK